MFPYQIYQALADQRLRDLRAEARRHELVAVARLAHPDRAGRSSRLKAAVTTILAASHISMRRNSAGPRATSTTASTPGAGPLGCIA